MSSRAKAAFVGSIHRPFAGRVLAGAFATRPATVGADGTGAPSFRFDDFDRRGVRCARNCRPRGPGGARRRRRRHAPVRDARRTRKSEPRRRRRDAARRMALHQRPRRQLENGQRLRVGPEHEPGPGLQQQWGIPIRLRLRRRRRGPVRQILEPGPLDRPGNRRRLCRRGRGPVLEQQGLEVQRKRGIHPHLRKRSQRDDRRRHLHRGLGRRMPSREHPRRRQPARRRDLPGRRADRQPADPRRARAAARPRQGSGILLGWGLHPVVPDRKSRRIHPGQRGIPLRPQHLRPAAEMDQHRDADGPLLARFRARRRLHRQPDLHRPGNRRADRKAGSSPRCSTSATATPRSASGRSAAN